MYKIIIIGAGFAGIQATKNFNKSIYDVTLIDKRNYHLFQPLLYQVATAGLSPADIANPIRSIFKLQKNVKVILDELIKIDPDNKEVTTLHNKYIFDFLILATGSQLNYFGNENWKKFSPGLKNIEDATYLRHNILEAFEKAERSNNSEELKKLMTFVIIGGGPTGIEIASSIAELSKKVLVKDFKNINTRKTNIILLEAGERLLSSAAKNLSIYCKNKLETFGIEVQCNTSVKEISYNEVLTSKGKIQSSNIIWCAGINSSPIRKWINIDVDKIGRAIVTDYLSIPNHDNIFVVGDAANIKDKKNNPLPSLAPVAKQQGRYVAIKIKKLIDKKPYKKFKYRNMGYLTTIGRSVAIVDFGWITFKGKIGWLFWSLVHIYFLIGFRNRLMVFINWIWSYITYGKGARLITKNFFSK